MGRTGLARRLSRVGISQRPRQSEVTGCVPEAAQAEGQHRVRPEQRNFCVGVLVHSLPAPLLESLTRI
jgi:hypothetical protein